MELKEHFLEPQDITTDVTFAADRLPAFTGNYSYVLRGWYCDQMVAIKVLKLVKNKTLAAMRRKFRRERAIWAVLDHRNIVRLLGYIERDELEFGALVSPWHKHGDAAAFLRTFGDAFENMQERMQLWNGVIAGVEYLHGHDPTVIHGDLKLDNILLDEQGTPLLCDFGLAHIFYENGHSGLTTTTEHTGTIRYLAPELILTNEKCFPTIESDVYALGCIGLEALFQLIPYAGDEQGHHIMEKIKLCVPPAYRPKKLRSNANAVWDMLESCWSPEPSNRITAKELLQLTDKWMNKHSNENMRLNSLERDLSSIAETSEDSTSNHHRSSSGAAFPIKNESTQQAVAPSKVPELPKRNHIPFNTVIEASKPTSRQVRFQPPSQPVIAETSQRHPSHSGISNPRHFGYIQDKIPTKPKPNIGSRDGILKRPPPHKPNSRFRDNLLRTAISSSQVRAAFASPTNDLPRNQDSPVLSESDNCDTIADKKLLIYPPSQRIFLPGGDKERALSGSEGSQASVDTATSGGGRRSFARSFRRHPRPSYASSTSSRSAISSSGSSESSIISTVSSLDQYDDLLMEETIIYPRRDGKYPAKTFSQ